MEPLTRFEDLLHAIAIADDTPVEPQTRKEYFLDEIRKSVSQWVAQIGQGGGGTGSATLILRFADPEETGEYTCDHTWKEIWDAVNDGIIPVYIDIGDDAVGVLVIDSVFISEGEEKPYQIGYDASNFIASAETENDYPSYTVI